MKHQKPTKSNITILNQVCKLIPQGLVDTIAQKHKIDNKSRTFTPWSHVASLIYAQLAHSVGLNDVCDALGNHPSALYAIGGATAPSKNGLSHANRTRDAQMAEDLFGPQQITLLPFALALARKALRRCPDALNA